MGSELGKLINLTGTSIYDCKKVNISSELGNLTNL